MLPSPMDCLTDKTGKKRLVEGGNVVHQRLRRGYSVEVTLMMSPVGGPRY